MEFSRLGLHRTLQYRTDLLHCYYGCLCLIPCGFLFAYQSFIDRDWWLLAQCGLVAFFGWFAARDVKPFRFTSIDVTSRSLVIQSPSQSLEIPFADIVNAYIPKFSLHHLLYLQLNDGRTVPVLLNLLERGEYVLDAIHTARSNLISHTRFLRYRRALVGMDHSLARMKFWGPMNLAKILIPPLAAMILFQSFIYLLYWRFSSSFAAHYILQLLLSAGIAFGCWTFTEMLHSISTQMKLRKDPLEVRRDLVFEKKVSRAFTIVHWGGLLVGVFLYLSYLVRH